MCLIQNSWAQQNISRETQSIGQTTGQSLLNKQRYKSIKYILQRGHAIKTYSREDQYLPLDNATSACVTHPEACTSGGSVAFWVNLLPDQDDGTMLSSCEDVPKSCTKVEYSSLK